MRNPPLPFDPFGLIRIGMAIWVTDLIVAQEIGQAVREQNELLAGGARGETTI